MKKIPGKRKKRPPIFPTPKVNEIYVRTQCHSIAIQQRIKTLMNKNTKQPIVLHALGKAIGKCIEIALWMRRYYGSSNIRMEVKTSTILLVDEIEPDDPNLDYIDQVRRNNAIHITLSKLKTDTIKNLPMNLSHKRKSETIMIPFHNNQKRVKKKNK
jgi:DNA-binding protein